VRSVVIARALPSIKRATDMLTAEQVDRYRYDGHLFRFPELSSEEIGEFAQASKGAVAMALPAGNFSLHHTLCRHRSAPNRASHRRIGLGSATSRRMSGRSVPTDCRRSSSKDAIPAVISTCCRSRRASSVRLDRHERVYRRYRQNDAAQCRGSLIDCFETPTVLLTSSQRRLERGGDSLKASQGRSPTCGVESSV
jgi:hypothetical protein